MKICSNCKIEKSNDSFGMNNSMPDLRQKTCRLCLSTQRKLAREKNPQIYKDQWKRNKYSKPDNAENRRLISSYGITVLIKNIYGGFINNRCEICSNKVKLVVDHDHETGGFRGLLCSKCNRGIGHFDDNPELLMKAVNYLEGNRHVI